MPDENGNYTADEVATLKSDAAKSLDAAKSAQAVAEGKVGEFNAKEELASLQTEFPKIPDVSILAGVDMEAKRKMGEEISKLIPDPTKQLTKEEIEAKAVADAEAKKKVDAAAAAAAYNGDKGNQFGSAGAHGGGTGEGSDGGKAEIEAKIALAQKVHNHGEVARLLMEGQPEAVKYAYDKSS